jgi:hypothetical protein
MSVPWKREEESEDICCHGFEGMSQRKFIFMLAPYFLFLSYIPYLLVFSLKSVLHKPAKSLCLLSPRPETVASSLLPPNPDLTKPILMGQPFA